VIEPDLLADPYPYLWLENVTGDRPLEWVRARNAESLTSP
jgi:prolyl oligopeptidase